jgi:hypothetical protein
MAWQKQHAVAAANGFNRDADDDDVSARAWVQPPRVVYSAAAAAFARNSNKPLLLLMLEVLTIRPVVRPVKKHYFM